ncbi:MAG TPA: TlpA disulfide reductase family protein [Acidimicrobiales bacterium]|nr:TlpA disulfide reductase family protein [Acidimicrobiales bacterium]
MTTTIEPPDAPEAGAPRRSRVVLYTCIGIGVVIAVFVAVLAAAKPASNTPTSTLIGKPAPAVSGPVLVGTGTSSLAQFSGKWVLVNFAASWCVPCVQETPEMKTFYARHQAAGDAQILAVAFDPTDQPALARFLRKSGAQWPAVSDPSAEVAYGVSQIPQSFLVSPNGTVAAKFFGAITAAEVDKVIAKDSQPQ